MKKSLSVVIGLSLFAISVSASAVYRPYIDLGLGYSAPQNMPSGDSINDLPGIVPVGDGEASADNYGGRIVGGILWDVENPVSYGLEVGAAYYGVVKYSNLVSSVDMNYYGIELLGVLQFNMDKLRLQLKGGVTDEQLHPTKSNIDNASFDDSQQILPEVGLGIGYAFTDNLQIGLSYYHTFGNDVTMNTSGGAENLPSVNMGLLEIMYMI